MQKKTPIKRHEALKQLSRDHHHGLLLCFKIRQGIKNNIEFERIKRYCEYFFKNYLIAHFKEEEEYIFPLLPQNHPMVKKALSQHRRLEKLFNQKEEPERVVSLIEEELERHIRFEERKLFNEIQEQASDKELQDLTKVLKRENPDVDKDWEDHFWEK